ncbi:hypothetical protein ACS0TY_002791 [Phlomoides rotata]
MDYMFSNEECSSGCESGWTLYLDHSLISSYDRHNHRSHTKHPEKSNRLKEEEEEEEEEDEDLSMVSDASSGPPHHVHEEDGNHDHNNGCSFNPYAIDHQDALMSRNRKKNREINRRRINNNNNKVLDRDSLLDDTASSPFFDFSDKSSTLTTHKTSMENVLEYSQGYSTTQFEQVRPPYQQHYDDFFQSGNQLQQHNQW